MTKPERPDRTVSALLIGDFSPPEFQPVAAQLRSVAGIETATDCRAAISLVSGAAYVPDVIVIAQLWPGQHHQSQLDRLQREVPLCRILALSGTWCEGESRSGTPWPGMIRTYWHAWLARWQGEFSRLAAAELPAWGLPTTSTEAERTLLTHDDAPTYGGLIAVCSDSHDSADVLCAACRQFGYGAVWLDRRHPPHVEGPTAIVWDGPPDALDDLAHVRTKFPKVPLLALMDFPRWEDVQQAKSCGVAAVLSKPWMIDDLQRQLNAIIKNHVGAASDHRPLRVVA